MGYYTTGIILDLVVNLLLTYIIYKLIGREKPKRRSYGISIFVMALVIIGKLGNNISDKEPRYILTMIIAFFVYLIVARFFVYYSLDEESINHE